MKFKIYFSNAIRQHFLDHSKQMIAQVENNYLVIEASVAFAKTSANPMDKRLEFIGYFLAFIQTLENFGQTYDQIREISLEVAYEYVKPKNKFQAWLKKLPMKFVNFGPAKMLLRSFNKKLNQRGHEDGFVAEIITDKAKTLGVGYGVNILECGVCKLFAKHDATKYVPILCDIDKITTEFAGLEMVMQGTISRGAPICDFRYKLK